MCWCGDCVGDSEFFLVILVNRTIPLNLINLSNLKILVNLALLKNLVILKKSGDSCEYGDERESGDDVVGRPTQLIYISDIYLLGWRWGPPIGGV